MYMLSHIVATWDYYIKLLLYVISQQPPYSVFTFYLPSPKKQPFPSLKTNVTPGKVSDFESLCCLFTGWFDVFRPNSRSENNLQSYCLFPPDSFPSFKGSVEEHSPVSANTSMTKYGHMEICGRHVNAPCNFSHITFTKLSVFVFGTAFLTASRSFNPPAVLLVNIGGKDRRELPRSFSPHPWLLTF